MERQWNFSIGTLHQHQVAFMVRFKPARERISISDRRRKQQRLHRSRQQFERKLPNDSPFEIIEAVEFVHHDRPHVGKIKRLVMQQSVEQNLSDHDQNFCIRIDAAVARHKPHVICRKAPPHSGRLQLLEFLIGERDERRRVISRAAQFQCFEHGRFGDQRFSRPRRRAN